MRNGRLLRTLTLADLSVLASSSMAPAYSLAAVMGLVVAAAGTGAPLALIVSTIPIIFIAIGFMRLATERPSAGAAYTWAQWAFGSRAGYFTAVLIIVGYYFGALACALPAAAYTIDLALPHFAGSALAIALAGICWTIFSAYFLIIGAQPTARLSAIFLAVEIAALAVIAVLAIVHPFAGTPPLGHAGFSMGSTGLSGLVVGAVLSIWVSAGWEISTYSSEESMGPATTPGAASLVGLVGTMALVWFCMVAFLHVGSVGGFASHQVDALAYVASRLGGGWIATLMVANVLVSSAAALWTTMQLLSRAVFAMARDGLLPAGLAAIHPKFGTPWVAVIAVSVPVALILLACGLVSSAQQALLLVVSGSSIFLGLTFIIAGLACARLHLRQRHERRHVFTGIVLPAVGAVWTLGFLVFDVWKQQTPMVQALTVGGLIAAFIFSVTAGLWTSASRPMTFIREEEA